MNHYMIFHSNGTFDVCMGESMREILEFYPGALHITKFMDGENMQSVLTSFIERTNWQPREDVVEFLRSRNFAI